MTFLAVAVEHEGFGRDEAAVGGSGEGGFEVAVAVARGDAGPESGVLQVEIGHDSYENCADGTPADACFPADTPT